MKKFYQIFISAILLTTIIVNAQTLTDDMKNFIHLAVAKNGDQKGYTLEDAAKYLNVNFTKSGRNYESDRTLESDPNQSVFEYSAHKGTRYLSFYFDDPIKTFEQTIDHLNGFEAAWFDRRQANGLPVYYFIGKNPSEYIKTRKLYIRIYECSDKAQEKCTRQAQLIFGQRQ